MLLTSLKKIAQSELKIFLSYGYSLELLFILKDMHMVVSITNLYDLIDAPKPKKATFDSFIRRLNAKGCLEFIETHDKRTKGIRLSENVQKLLNELNGLNS